MLIECSSRPLIDWRPATGWQVGDGIAVFSVQISRYAAYLPNLLSVLRPDEIIRANRYHRPPDMHRFVTTRAALRIILSQLLEIAPVDIEFQLGAHKKPLLAGGHDWHFNVSHAGDWALVAVGPIPVGVDVEKVDLNFDFKAVLQQVFSVPERQALAAAGITAECFFQTWTRKEAFAKATARGIDEGFSLIPGLDGRHPFSAPQSLKADWAITSFAVRENYQGAVAFPVSGDAPELLFYEFEDSWITRK